jgi:hypothetical protein
MANNMLPGNYYTNILSANQVKSVNYQIAKQCANIIQELKAVCVKVTPIVRKCTQSDLYYQIVRQV